LKSVQIPTVEHTGYEEDFKCDVCSTVIAPAEGEALTLKQAATLGVVLGTDKYTTAKYYVTGYISSIANTQYGNVYIVDDEGNEYPIINEDIVEDEVNGELSEDETVEPDYSIERYQRVAVPLKIIKNLKHSRIKIKYESESISKETFLNNNRRATYVFEDYDVDIGIGTRKELYIDVRYKNKNNVRIHDIIEDDSKFILIGSSQEKN
jgi:hypothetical protein